MQAWNDTLHNLLIILGCMPGTHDDVLSLAKDIRTKTAELFEDTKGILSKVSSVLILFSSLMNDNTSAINIKF